MTDTTEPLAEFITIAEASRRIGISRDCMYRALKAGDVPGGQRFAGRWVIARAPFEAWLTGDERKPIDFVYRRKLAS